MSGEGELITSAEPIGWGRVEGAHDDAALVAALVRGDEAAFIALVDRYHAAMIRAACRFVPSPAIAEEVVQETWIGLFRGIDGFAGRSSLKTWLFTILLNQARRRGAAEHRSVPFSALSHGQGDPVGPSVDPERFFPSGHPDAGHWTRALASWGSSVEDALLSMEVAALIRQNIDALPEGIRLVITLRDLEGWSADEVCNGLGISDTNQRVRLHRARSRVRDTLERYFAGAS